MDLKKYLFELTPTGKADKELRKHLEGERKLENLGEYEKSLKRYRNIKTVQTTVRILLYASIITSVVTTLGLEQVRLLQQIASYIGATILLAAYAITSYFTLMARELYHVEREILLSQT